MSFFTLSAGGFDVTDPVKSSSDVINLRALRAVPVAGGINHFPHEFTSHPKPIFMHFSGFYLVRPGSSKPLEEHPETASRHTLAIFPTVQTSLAATMARTSKSPVRRIKKPLVSIILNLKDVG
ncbi:hypothetical protein DTO164E3_817 [Paecilomyces variotii]|nr:hypothetical protein DTO032I3_8160 [Paecilomyces variotii]KAJ9206576.1 hypothetical protein DTO164E3_817 [Paecilomyces variotii]KAJ9275282.1 hypothetical protein DTO021D3_7820 [Paecilomyces variotii]KAJ9297138.1 hypothetical protein DTO217A2_8692 [Paecilomyces variotii]KAJ9339302.1 hypothetical protein DTO027B6_8185 [Paecilomyces variotii]